MKIKQIIIIRAGHVSIIRKLPVNMFGVVWVKPVVLSLKIKKFVSKLFCRQAFDSLNVNNQEKKTNLFNQRC